MRRTAAFAVVIWLSSFAPSYSATTSSDDLQLWCADREYLEFTCAGYIRALFDVMADGNEVSGARACIPAGVTVEEARNIAIDYLESNLQEAPQSAPVLIAAALAQAFPCQ